MSGDGGWYADIAYEYSVLGTGSGKCNYKERVQRKRRGGAAVLTLNSYAVRRMVLCSFINVCCRETRGGKNPM